MTIYKTESVQEICRNINLPSEVFKADTPSLGLMKRTYGDKFVRAYIAMWILDISSFLNIGKNMGESQVRQTATMILDEYIYLTIADIGLVFKRAKHGFYGQIFDRLDGQIILGWFREYNNERCQAGQEESINEANSFKDRDYRTDSRETLKMDQLQKPIYKKAKFKK